MTELWDGVVNFASYAEVEARENYATVEELEAYRDERLRMYEPAVAFLRGPDVPPRGLRVVDVGAGSSAFLYALERAGLLERGLGIELSASRHEFAERWRLDAGFTRVTNMLGNFAEADLPPGSFDRFTVLDDTYLLLRPEDDRYGELLLDVAYRALEPGGLFVASFRNDAPLVASMGGGERSFWVELPDSNAFKFALYRQRASDDGSRLRNESVYIGRDLGETRKVEITEVCDVHAFAAAIERAGFGPPSLHADFACNPFDPARSPHVVVVAPR
jgi:SAM-dependent methyltransferase